MYDVVEHLLIEGFLQQAMQEDLLRQLRAAEHVPAKVYGSAAGGRIDDRMRRARMLLAPDAVRNTVATLFMDAQQSLAQHFGIALSRYEEPQYLRYLPGDFFVAHQDGNTGLIRDDSMHRRVSVSVFLNSSSVEPREGSYGGGELVLHGPYPSSERYVIPATAGALVAFRSETTHEVVPVTHGERYAIVSWYR